MVILEAPNYPPYVCISCGVGTGRKWFVSLDFPLDHYYNPVLAGTVFQCNECWESLATSVAKAVQVYLIGMEPWDSGEFVEPKFDNVTELRKEVVFGGGSTGNVLGEVSAVATGNDSSTQSDSSATTTSSTTTDNATDDPEAGPVSEFRIFFGGDEPVGGESA